VVRLIQTLNAWQTVAFTAAFKAEVERLDADLLPLQQGLSHSSQVNAGSLSVMILSVTEQPACIQVKAGLFYTGSVAGCSCADDPTPLDEINEYCEVRFDIDKRSAATTIALLRDA
jgi:hypothetical protein